LSHVSRAVDVTIGIFKKMLPDGLELLGSHG
jgi:hypothetical protein